MKITFKDVEDLLKKQMSYSLIAETLGTSKENVAKIVAQIRFSRDTKLGALDAEVIRKRYLDDVEEIDTIAADAGVSIVQLRRFLQAKRFFRDRGTVYRAGTIPKMNKGVRVPGSKRDLAAQKPDAWSLEHREKLAAAKRGKIGEQANRWNGGHEIGGYVSRGGGVFKNYEHRWIAQEALGRTIFADEHVHHIDKNKKNNEPINLLVLKNSVHSALHHAMRQKVMDRSAQIRWLKENNKPFEDVYQHAKNSK